MIHGRCHTADNTLSLEFDATPWFKEADAESIRRPLLRDELALCRGIGDGTWKGIGV